MKKQYNTPKFQLHQISAVSAIVTSAPGSIDSYGNGQSSRPALSPSRAEMGIPVSDRMGN